MLVKLEMAALRGEVASELRASQSVYAACPRILAPPWTAVLNDEYACGLCTLNSLRHWELGNAEMHGEWAS